MSVFSHFYTPLTFRFEKDPKLDAATFSTFAVTGDCQVSAVKTLDRDNGSEFYVLRILAIDQAEQEDVRCTSTATLTVNIQDLNDNAPEPYLVRFFISEVGIKRAFLETLQTFTCFIIISAI